MAVITIAGFQFLTAQSQSGGFLFKLSVPEEEILATEGVDGKRWRTTYRQMTPDVIETLTDAADWGSAVALCDSYRRQHGTLAAVTWTAGGYTFAYKDVHVGGVAATPVAGAAVGGGAASNSTCHVRTTWILEPTDFDPFATL